MTKLEIAKQRMDELKQMRFITIDQDIMGLDTDFIDSMLPEDDEELKRFPFSLRSLLNL